MFRSYFTIFILLFSFNTLIFSGDEDVFAIYRTGSLEDIRNFQFFFYSVGGRDPMTMRLPLDSESYDPLRNIKQSQPTTSKSQVTLEQMNTYLEDTIKDIESKFKVLDFSSALEVSKAALDVINNDWPPLRADPPRLRLMYNQVVSYNKLSEYLKTQEDIKEEFDKLDLTINGISWSPTNSRAIINNQALYSGEFVNGIDDLRVESIEERMVIFLYKGLKFNKVINY